MAGIVSDDNASTADPLALPAHRRARIVLVAFVLTFLISRVLVLLIMTRRLPDLFFHVGTTHVHHLNYGIFLLCIAAGWSLFVPLRGRALRTALRLYGVGLALTFDEFGMWLHLGGGYWQRASYDAVIVIASLLALFAYSPSLKRFHARHWILLVVIVLILTAFAALLIERLSRFGTTMGPWFESIERTGPQ
jgi:hypothetical protein